MVLHSATAGTIGVAASAARIAVDGTSCVAGGDSLGCAGMWLNFGAGLTGGAALGFGAGGAAVAAPFAGLAGWIDVTS